MELKEILRIVTQRGGSDLHLSVGMPAMIRIAGHIEQLGEKRFSNEEIINMLRTVIPREREIIQGVDIDLGISVEGIGRFRANIYHDLNGVCAAFRPIPHHIKTIKELGLPTIVDKIHLMKHGLVLVTGVTGSGKTTTLASIIQLINLKKKYHVITIEDPIEFIHTNASCIINQREVGIHAASFSKALISALREDPNVILVGELRDLDTISMALTAAETGHLVLTTLHTKDAPQTIDRIIDVFPAHQQAQIRVQLANTLKMVISQVLVSAMNGKERFLASEVMIVTSAIRKLIRDSKTYQLKSEIQTGSSRFGMQTLEGSIKELVNAGKINIADVYHLLYDEQIFGKELPQA